MPTVQKISRFDPPVNFYSTDKSMGRIQGETTECRKQLYNKEEGDAFRKINYFQGVIASKCDITLPPIQRIQKSP